MNLGDHLNLNSKNEKAADVLSSFMSSEEASGNREIKKTTQEPQADLEKTKDAPLELKELNNAFARFQKKYEKYHQRPTFGQWKEFVEQEKIPLKEARKELSGLWAGESSIKTDKEGLATIDSLLGYVSRLNGGILDSDKGRIRYNRSVTKKHDENPTAPPKYQAYNGDLPTGSQQWVQKMPSLEESTDQNNIVVPGRIEHMSAQHTDNRLREGVVQDPVVNKLMDTILPIPEKKITEPVAKPNKTISKPRVVYDPRKKSEELDALEYNTAYHNQQAEIRRNIQKELLSKTTTTTTMEPEKPELEEAHNSQGFKEQKKFIVEQVESMTEEERRDMTKTLSQQFLEESLINGKHRAIDLSVFEKPGMFSKDFITQVLLEDADKNSTIVESAGSPAVIEEAKANDTLEDAALESEVGFSDPDSIDSSEAMETNLNENEPRIFRKDDGTEVRENLSVETEDGFINVSPLDANNRYAVGEEKLERVLRTFQDAEGNTLQETNHPGVGEGYVNVKGADGRQYARKIEGLTRVDSTVQKPQKTSVDTPQQPDTKTPDDLAPIENKQPENIETTDMDLVRQAYESGTRPVLNYKGYEMNVVSMSGGTMVVAYGDQRRTIDAGEELAKDMQDGKISFTIPAETQSSTPESRQEKAQKDFQEKYKADIKDQPLWERLYDRVRYGRGEGDFLEKQAMSDETKESYEKYQDAMKEKAQSTHDAFLSKMDGKDDWDDVRKQEVAKRLRDRYYGIQYIRGRQSLLRELRTEAIEEKRIKDTGIMGTMVRGIDAFKEKNPKLVAAFNFAEKWKNFEKNNKKDAALLKVGGASILFAGSVVAFGGLRVLGGALGGFVTRTALNSKYARVGNFNLHTEELIRAQHKGNIEKFQAKAEQWGTEVQSNKDRWASRTQADSDYHVDEDMPFKIQQAREKQERFQEKTDSEYGQFMERSRVEQLRKDFENGKLDGVALQQKLESIDRGDVRRFRANWFFTALAAGISGRVAGQSEVLHTALSDLGVPRDWMDGYFFAVKGENPQPISQDNFISPEPTAQRAAEVVIPEVTPDPVVVTPEPTVVTPTVVTPDPVIAQNVVTPPIDTVPQVQAPTVIQTPIEQVVPTDTVVTQPEYQAPPSQWKGGEINVEMKGPKIDGFKGTGTYEQHLPGATDFSNDPTYGYVPPQQGGPINTSGPIVNPNAKMGPGGRIVLDPGGNGEFRVDIGNGKNIPTRNDNPTGPADVITGIFKGR